MFKVPLEEFIAEIMAELSLVEEDLAMGWELDFRKLIEDNKLNGRLFTDANGKTLIKLEDEADLFGLADAYIEAIESNERDKYWQAFQ